MKLKFLIIGLIIQSCWIKSQAQIIVTIDKKIQYQTIEGFGGNIENYDDNIRQTNVMTLTDKDADILVNDLGCTIFRHLFDGTMEPKNDNDDPKSLDDTKLVYGINPGLDACQGNVQYPFLNAVQSYAKLKSRIEKNGDKSQIYSSIFSPPAWMKYVNCVMGADFEWNRVATDEEEKSKGGTDGIGPAKTKDFKDEFAEFCYAYIKTMDKLGLKVDAFSIQNEPVFPQSFYSSAVYSPESYGAMFKRVGQRLRAEGYNTKMMFTEDIGDIGRYNQFVQIITRDIESNKFADIAAVHSYAANGISAGSTDASLWQSLDKISRQRSPIGTTRPFWQTETSGYVDHFDKSIAIYTALKYGKVNAWMTHKYNSWLANFDKPQINREYYGAKHYFKYIRQGSVSVGATSSNEKILVTAFQSDKHKQLSIQLINADTVNAKEVKILTSTTSGNPLNYKMYLTTPTGNNFCSDKGTILAGSTFTIPAKSILTLVGENSISEIPTASEDEVSQANKNEIMIFPNPSQNGFYIQSNSIVNSPTEIIIQDLNGKELIKTVYNYNGEHLYINASNIPNGIYMLKYNNLYKKVILNK